MVSCQNEKSQLQNKEQALRILRSRLLVAARETADAAAADARRSQVRTVDRSERIRTYNFPENRITDHRVGYKAYNLDAVLAGDLDGVLDALATADRAQRLAGRRPSDSSGVARPGAPRMGEPRQALRVAHPGGRGHPRRGRRAVAAGATPRSSPRTCSGIPRPGSGLVPLIDPAGRRALPAADRPRAPPGSRCST